jgi:hypothetical protein
VQSLPCTEHNLQTNKGIAPTHGLESLDFPAKDTEKTGGVCATTVSTPEPPGDADEAGGVLAAIVETPEPHKDIEKAGKVCAAIVSTPEQPKDPEGLKNMLLAKEVDTEAFDIRMPTEDKHTACLVAKVPSQPRSLDLDDPTIPVAYLASSYTAIPMETSP